MEASSTETSRLLPIPKGIDPEVFAPYLDYEKSKLNLFLLRTPNADDKDISTAVEAFRDYSLTILHPQQEYLAEKKQREKDYGIR